MTPFPTNLPPIYLICQLTPSLLINLVTYSMRKEQYNYIHHCNKGNGYNHYVPAAGDQHVPLHPVHSPTIPSLLPPGFRFHPTDEELVSFYLASKIRNPTFTDRAVTDADLNKLEPWELPGNHKYKKRKCSH